MSSLRLEVTLAPYIREEILKIAAEYKGRQDTAESRAALEAEVSYRLHYRLGVPPGTFVVTAVSEDT